MKRPSIIVTRAAMDALAVNALLHGHRFHADRDTRPLARGRWRVPVDQDVFDRLHQIKRRGETMSAVILRMARGEP